MNNVKCKHRLDNISRLVVMVFVHFDLEFNDELYYHCDSIMCGVWIMFVDVFFKHPKSFLLSITDIFLVVRFQYSRSQAQQHKLKFTFPV